MPPGQVANSLLERDLAMLLKYAEKHLLPHRRMQLQLAKVAQYVHADSTKPLSHYIVGFPQAANDGPDDTAEDVGSIFAAVSGGNVVMLKGRKKVN